MNNFIIDDSFKDYLLETLENKVYTTKNIIDTTVNDIVNIDVPELSNTFNKFKISSYDNIDFSLINRSEFAFNIFKLTPNDVLTPTIINPDNSVTYNVNDMNKIIDNIEIGVFANELEVKLLLDRLDLIFIEANADDRLKLLDDLVNYFIKSNLDYEEYLKIISIDNIEYVKDEDTLFDKYINISTTVRYKENNISLDIKWMLNETLISRKLMYDKALLKDVNIYRILLEKILDTQPV